MNSVLITGSAQGIGYATVLKFLKEGFKVFGMDYQPCPDSLLEKDNYKHLTVSVNEPENFEDLGVIDYIVCNAGIQRSEKEGEVMQTNYWGVNNIFKKYVFQDRYRVKGIVIVGSVSGITGAEFQEYVASKGALIPCTKYVANYVAHWGGVCNYIAPGGVSTELNEPVMSDPVLWNRIMDLTPLKRWAEPSEIADWIYFIATQRFCTGQTIVVDGGESIKTNFIWPSDTSV